MGTTLLDKSEKRMITLNTPRKWWQIWKPYFEVVEVERTFNFVADCEGKTYTEVKAELDDMVERNG